MKMVKLTIITIFGCSNFKSNENRKLKKLYKTGMAKISQMYSIDKIVRDMRKYKNLVKNHLSQHLSQRTLFEIQHSKKFVINLDSSEEDSKMTPDKAILKIQKAWQARKSCRPSTIMG